RSTLLMPDRTYFSLDHPAFDGLRELIREGEALAEWEPEQQQISRFQVDMWDDLQEVADETVAAREWDRTAVSLRDLEQAPPPALPRCLQAELRPYQLEGFTWLAFLFRHGLGGVLADDMGLGKTLQTLALIGHAREQAPQDPPFLVVAPASVLPVWRHEAERFTPGLDVRVLDRTARSRGTDLASAILGADVVVTSYSVLRIDEEEFAGSRFQGFVLDEAQFVKNRRSRTHRAAKGVRAGFRLAITGTPMENSLDDLWAIFDLVSPGLLGTALGFRRRSTLPDGAAAPPGAALPAAPHQGAGRRRAAGQERAGAHRDPLARASRRLRLGAAAGTEEGAGPDRHGPGPQPLHRVPLPDAAADAGAGPVAGGRRGVRRRAQLEARGAVRPARGGHRRRPPGAAVQPVHLLPGPRRGRAGSPRGAVRTPGRLHPGPRRGG